MPEIYSSAWNVVLCLGDAHGGHSWADGTPDATIKLLPKLFYLKLSHSMQEQGQTSDSVLESWVFFQRSSTTTLVYSSLGTLTYVSIHTDFHRLFIRPSRSSKIACARRLSLCIGTYVVSWIDFADAAEFFFEERDRIRVLYGQSLRTKYYPHALLGVETSGAKVLVELLRNIFRKIHYSSSLIKPYDLEPLVLSTEIRGDVYALPHLANDVVAVTFRKPASSTRARTGYKSEHQVPKQVPGTKASTRSNSERRTHTLPYFAADLIESLVPLCLT
jgi:hypothetical protein